MTQQDEFEEAELLHSSKVVDEMLEAVFLDSLRKVDTILENQKEQYTTYLAEDDTMNRWFEAQITEVRC